MKIKGRRGQAFLQNFLVMVASGILLYLGIDYFISPMITAYASTQSIGTQLLIKLIIPIIFFIYVLIFMKVIRRGDGGVGDE